MAKKLKRVGPNPKDPSPPPLRYTQQQQGVLDMADRVRDIKEFGDCSHIKEAVVHLTKHALQLKKAEWVRDAQERQTKVLLPYRERIEVLQVEALDKHVKLNDLLPRVKALRQELIDAGLLVQGESYWRRHETQWSLWQTAAYASSKQVLYRRLGSVTLPIDDESNITTELLCRVQRDHNLSYDNPDAESCC